MSTREYTRRDLNKFAEANESQLTYWTKIGILRGDVREKGGTGVHQVYSLRGVIEARLAVCLAAVGARTAIIELMVEQFRFYTTRGAEGSLPAMHAMVAAANNKGTPPSQRTLIRQMLASAQADAKERFAEWEAFADQSRRDEFGFVGFLYYPLAMADPWSGDEDERGRWRWLVLPKGERPDIDAVDAVLVIDVGKIVRDLEAKTGDRWPTLRR